MNNYEVKLGDLKNKIEVAKNKKIKAETRLEQLQNQRDEIIKELHAMGVLPENLGVEIENLRKEIESLISEIEKMIPSDI